MKTNSSNAESAADIGEMSREHHVSLIAEVESEKTTAEVPPDSYGFAYASSLLYNEPMLLRVTYWSKSFEIHKLHDGSLTVLGYVGPETFVRIREAARRGDDITLYSVPLKQASVTQLVSLPLSRLKCGRYREVDPATALDCKIVN